MIELKEAIENGKNFLNDIYGQPEEIILDSAKPDDNYWLIKFRIPLNIKPINTLQNVLGINKRIFYKTVKVDENGRIIEIINEELSQSQTIDIEPLNL
ncbi:MAG: hypothetical protein ACR2IA_06040 [Pyrinomonadaceae bacterium]